MDIQTLAAQLAALLLPALPSLLKAAGEKAAETLGEETVKTLWEKLKSRGRVAQAAVDDPISEPGFTNSRNAPLYRLLFACKHPLGNKFWQDVTKNLPGGQMRLTSF
jgi:hypothetical protein